MDALGPLRAAAEESSAAGGGASSDDAADDDDASAEESSSLNKYGVELALNSACPAGQCAGPRTYETLLAKLLDAAPYDPTMRPGLAANCTRGGAVADEVVAKVGSPRSPPSRRS